MKCSICKKKIPLVFRFKCKCEKCFCSKHRFPNHTCEFDYHNDQKEKLETENKVIKPKKVEDF